MDRLNATHASGPRVWDSRQTGGGQGFASFRIWIELDTRALLRIRRVSKRSRDRRFGLTNPLLPAPVGFPTRNRRHPVGYWTAGMDWVWLLAGCEATRGYPTSRTNSIPSCKIDSNQPANLIPARLVTVTLYPGNQSGDTGTPSTQL
jgi:hypothetical protein